MSETEKPKKPKPGNPSWPSGLPRSLTEIDNDRFRSLGLNPGRGRGALSWGKWGPDEARRQGQRELALPLDLRMAVREEIERNATAPRQARVPKRAKRPHRHTLEDAPLAEEDSNA